METVKTSGNLYIDLSKAFDTLAFDILLFKLKYYGVTNTELSLTNQKQYVVINNKQSDYSEVYTGVPHGSILSPLFFSIYSNDLITAIDKLKFVMFTDFNLEDFDSQNTEADINTELENFNTWVKLNKLLLNAQKTKLVLFHRKQKHVNDVDVKIDNTMIEHVQTFNCLGIMLNETLSWKSHIAMVSNTISKAIGILYRLKHVFPEYVLFTLYNSLIVSYINYELLLWGVDCHKPQSLCKRKQYAS